MLKKIFILILFFNSFCLAEDDQLDSFSFDEKGTSKAEIESCKSSRGTARPRIKLDEVQPMGGRGSTIYMFKGEVIGSCIDEAGYYEYGKIKDKFTIPLNDQLVRFEFNVVSYRGINAEIKVFSLDGRQYTVNVDEEIQRARH